MANLEECGNLLLETRRGLISLINLYVERKNECKEKIENGDDLHTRYNQLRNKYKVLSKLAAGKVKDADIKELQKQNSEHTAQLQKIEDKIGKCKHSAKSTETHIDVMKMKLKVGREGAQTAALGLREELETLEDELDLDYYQSEIIKPMVFSTIKECEADLSGLEKLQRRLLKEYKDMDAKCFSKLKDIETLRSQYQELEGHHLNLLQTQSAHEDTFIYKLLLDNETILQTLKSKTEILRRCDDHIREINKQYTILAAEFNAYISGYKMKRTTSLTILSGSLDEMDDVISDITESMARVTIDPNAKKTSTHKVLNKK